MPGEMILKIWDVEHGACAMLNGVHVATTGRRRHALTKRRDGWIEINVNDRGKFTIFTERHG